MPNTTNYNWATPADTDLVKDGAAAIRTLGSSVDTTVKNLNPGTTAGDIDYYTSSTAKARVAIGTANQVLRVNSAGTAPEWATTADQTPLTTKGDLFGFDTADARIPIGANGTVLTADSTQNLGLKWAAPAAAGFKGCRLTFGSAVTVANGTNVTVNWDVETFDTDAFHSTSSNTSRITIPSGLGGKYLYCVKGLFENQAAGLSIIRLYKNGTQVLTVDMYKPSGAYTTTAFSDIIELVATDYLEIVWYQNTGSSGTLQAGQSTSFGVQFLGA